MNTKERLAFCSICKNKKIDFHEGLICNISNAKPAFENTCKDFSKDIEEAERILKIKLDGAGNSKAKNGSLNPEKNINYGSFLIVCGLIVFLFSLLFGAIITFTGISFVIRGKQQKKIIEENDKFNEKL
jgi:hypothetical protein